MFKQEGSRVLQQRLIRPDYHNEKRSAPKLMIPRPSGTNITLAPLTLPCESKGLPPPLPSLTLVCEAPLEWVEDAVSVERLAVSSGVLVLATDVVSDDDVDDVDVDVIEEDTADAEVEVLASVDVADVAGNVEVC